MAIPLKINWHFISSIDNVADNEENFPGEGISRQ
jgi:hypothetical protein